MMSDSELVLGGKFRVFRDGSVNRVLDNGRESPANFVYTSRGRKYAAVTYWVDGEQRREYVHRLIAQAFIPNPHGLPQVNHIDGNTKNNTVENLEWCTVKHNMQHAYANGLINHRRSGRRCASCGAAIADRNQGGLCRKCMTNTRAAEAFRSNRVFLGVIEYHKRVENMSNEDIARCTGYAKDTIDKFMCGQKITKNVAHKICDLFSIDRALFTTRTY